MGPTFSPPPARGEATSWFSSPFSSPLVTASAPRSFQRQDPHRPSPLFFSFVGDRPCPPFLSPLHQRGDDPNHSSLWCERMSFPPSFLFPPPSGHRKRLRFFSSCREKKGVSSLSIGRVRPPSFLPPLFLASRKIVWVPSFCLQEECLFNCPFLFVLGVFSRSFPPLSFHEGKKGFPFPFFSPFLSQ